MSEYLDAKRYRLLRKQHWFDGKVCVVKNPKKAVKPGCECPSEDRLDEFIDNAMRED